MTKLALAIVTASLALAASEARADMVVFDPQSNLDAGVRHLKDLMTRLELPMALAAYNAGEATIKRYGGLPPFPQTQTYVRNILRRLGSSGAN